MRSSRDTLEILNATCHGETGHVPLITDIYCLQNQVPVGFLGQPMRVAVALALRMV